MRTPDDPVRPAAPDGSGSGRLALFGPSTDVDHRSGEAPVDQVPTVGHGQPVGVRAAQVVLHRMIGLEAADGDTGLELAQEHAPSVILLDHRMPGRDGVETATALRALDGGSGFLIIGLSASVTPELRERWLQAGADSVLEKSAEDRVLIRHMLRLTEQAPAAELELTADPELRDMLVDELPLQVDAILQSWQRRDTRAVYDAVHQLHGTAAFYKLHALREVSRRLESRLAALSDTEALDELAPLRSTP